MRLLAGPVLTRTRSSVALVTYLRPLAELALRPPCPELALPVLDNAELASIGLALSAHQSSFNERLSSTIASSAAPLVALFCDCSQAAHWSVFSVAQFLLSIPISYRHRLAKRAPSAAEEGNALLGDWLCRLPGRGKTAGFLEALVKPVEDFIISGGDFEFDAPSATTRVLSEEKAAEVPRARPTAFPV